jgi:transcriptional regulator with XRE-family HTH domain
VNGIGRYVASQHYILKKALVLMGRNAILASRIRELRQSIGFTQQDLSHASGLSRSYISRLEMGDIALPSRDRLRALATALNTSLDDLLQAAGFLDAPAEENDLPDVEVYLKRKYGIQDRSVLKAFETLIQSMSRYTPTPSGDDREPR